MSTPDICVRVKTRHLPDHLPSDSTQYAFAYHITIDNKSNSTVQLINRYWKITDANGKSTEVRGAGVIGKQPVMQPNEQFEYTSGAVLDTPVGSMEGHYEMENENGERFTVPIAAFRLAKPSILH